MQLDGIEKEIIRDEYSLLYNLEGYGDRLQSLLLFD